MRRDREAKPRVNTVRKLALGEGATVAWTEIIDSAAEAHRGGLSRRSPLRQRFFLEAAMRDSPCTGPQAAHFGGCQRAALSDRQPGARGPGGRLHRPDDPRRPAHRRPRMECLAHPARQGEDSSAALAERRARVRLSAEPNLTAWVASEFTAWICSYGSRDRPWTYPGPCRSQWPERNRPSSLPTTVAPWGMTREHPPRAEARADRRGRRTCRSLQRDPRRRRPWARTLGVLGDRWATAMARLGGGLPRRPTTRD